jgi:hypothetical protein
MKTLCFRLLLCVAAGAALQCGYRPSEAAKSSMLIVYSTGDAYVTVPGKPETRAVAGMLVRANDVIRTENGTLDMQTSRRAAVRVREYTTLAVSEIREKAALLKLKKGAVLARVDRESKEESFSIQTPTAVAGVRGTTFSIGVGEDNRSQLRVIQGQVSFAVHIPVLEGKTPEQIQADPLLQKLARIQAQEAVIEDRMQGRLDEKLEKQLIESAVPPKVEDVRPVVAEKIEMPALEVLESRTLVTVNPELIDKSIRGEARAAEEIEKEREEARERVLEQIKGEVSAIEMNTEEEIRKRYARLELITLNSGETIRGAVIVQTGNALLVHTTSGVKRIPRSDLRYQEPL